jgi:hypothetical protein
MPVTTFSSLPKIEVAGTPLADQVAAHVQEVVVDQSIHFPDMFHIVFMDPAQTVLEDAHLGIGTPISISAVPV